MKDRAEKPAQTAPPNQKAQSTASQQKPTSVEKRSHQVRRGETLFSIAKKYGMSPEELRRVNHLSNNSIQPGQRLSVDTK
jgi:LysM repeat protein